MRPAITMIKPAPAVVMPIHKVGGRAESVLDAAAEFCGRRTRMSAATTP
jgi:hypothetical protein